MIDDAWNHEREDYGHIVPTQTHTHTHIKLQETSEVWYWMTLSNAEVTQDVFKMIKQTSTLSSPQNKEKN
jgi:hypothetical protein